VHKALLVYAATVVAAASSPPRPRLRGRVMVLGSRGLLCGGSGIDVPQLCRARASLRTSGPKGAGDGVVGIGPDECTEQLHEIEAQSSQSAVEANSTDLTYKLD
jgi:hypothetical protein